MEYLNKRRKDMIHTVVGLETALRILMSEGDEWITPYTKRLKTICSYCQSITRGWLEKMPVEQVRMIRRYIENHTILIVTDPEAKSKKELSIVSADVLNRLINAASEQCLCCELKHNEVKKCQLRSDLLEAGAEVYDNNKGTCPFKKGL